MTKKKQALTQLALRWFHGGYATDEEVREFINKYTYYPDKYYDKDKEFCIRMALYEAPEEVVKQYAIKFSETEECKAEVRKRKEAEQQKIEEDKKAQREAYHNASVIEKIALFASDHIYITIWMIILIAYVLYSLLMFSALDKTLEQSFFEAAIFPFAPLAVIFTIAQLTALNKKQ